MSRTYRVQRDRARRAHRVHGRVPVRKAADRWWAAEPEAVREALARKMSEREETYGHEEREALEDLQ